MELDWIPGCGAAAMAGKDDIYLLDGGKRYREYFDPEGDCCGFSLFEGLSKMEKRAGLSCLYPKMKKREAFQYSGKFFSPSRGMRWVRIQGTFLEEREGKPVYAIILTDLTEDILTKMQLEEAVRSLERRNQELEEQLLANGEDREDEACTVRGGG